MGRRRYITLERLAELTADELKTEWARRYDTASPNLSPDLLRLGVGYKLQEQRLGGIGRSTRLMLRQMAANSSDEQEKKPPPRKLTPGTRLVRDWHGIGHTVIVREQGFEYNGKLWKTLTAVAKAITGAHWNGPLFFGLTIGKKKP